MILSLERLGAHAANVLPFVAVRQLVLGQSRCVAKDFAAHLFVGKQLNIFNTK